MRMMRSKKWLYLVGYSLLAVCVLAFVILALKPALSDNYFSSTVAARDDDVRPHIAVTITCVDVGSKDGQPPIAIVSFTNLDDSPVYIHAIDELTPLVEDAKGNRVAGKVIECKLPPLPPHHYMMKDGKRIHMQPVWRLAPKHGVSCVVSDILKGYSPPPSPGQYRLVIPIKTILTFAEEQVVQRPDTDELFWVEASAKRNRIPVAVNAAPFALQQEQ